MSNSRKTFSIMVFFFVSFENVVCDCGLGENVILLIIHRRDHHIIRFCIYPHHHLYIQYKIQIFPLYLAVVVRWYIVVDIVKVHLHIRSKKKMVNMQIPANTSPNTFWLWWVLRIIHCMDVEVMEVGLK